MKIKTTSITGYSGTIKNNLKNPTEHFTWKMDFPKSFNLENISKDDILLLNNNLQKVKCEYDFNLQENAIYTSPASGHETDMNYFLIINGNSIMKGMCIAYCILPNNEMITYNGSQSLEMLKLAAEKASKRNLQESALNEGTGINTTSEILNQNTDDVKKSRKIKPVLILLLLLLLAAPVMAYFYTTLEDNTLLSVEDVASKYNWEFIGTYVTDVKDSSYYDVKKMRFQDDVYKFYLHNPYANNCEDVRISLLKDGIIMEEFDVADEYINYKVVNGLPVCIVNFKKESVKILVK